MQETMNDVSKNIVQVLPENGYQIHEELQIRVVEIHIGYYAWIYRNNMGALLGGKFGTMDELTQDVKRKMDFYKYHKGKK